MSLERIDKVIWPNGTILESDANHRKMEMGWLGFPDERIITTHGRENLDTINAVEAVLRDIGDPPPDNFHLLAVPGSMEGSPESLVRKAYEVILEREPLSNAERKDLLRAMDPVLNKTRRTEKTKTPKTFPGHEVIHEQITSLVAEIEGEINKNTVPDNAARLQEIVNIVRRKMIIVLFGRGMHVLPGGKVIARLGLIDGAFDMSDLERHPNAVVAVLEEIIASRLS